MQQFAPRRVLGRTGFVATVLGIGDVADRSLSLETCVATVRRAIDAGLNLIDTAPGYEDGFSEIRNHRWASASQKRSISASVL
jgi:aryl-alcohol dehydrogenase-like predicted oxidoreductase